ncbi:PGF-CTERM sorting domain-containing protein [Salinigranum sp. GCM10025319]|uniref:PGF-CTERM sorting domain-containing protein n=1 Tax=Salinigranum sp. GCM10025319 TaxID=3252687 RepID=UPI00360BC01F
MTPDPGSTTEVSVDLTDATDAGATPTTFPGLSVTVAVIALVAAALLAGRRD